MKTIDIDLDALTDRWADDVRLTEIVANKSAVEIEALMRQAFQEGVYRALAIRSRSR